MTSTRKFHMLLGASLLLAAAAAQAKPVKVFILAGQSNMDGQADIRTIDFLGEDKDPAKAALLKTFKPDGKEYDTLWMPPFTLDVTDSGKGLGEVKMLHDFNDMEFEAIEAPY
jgi:alpha-galactosidase